MPETTEIRFPAPRPGSLPSLPREGVLSGTPRPFSRPPPRPAIPFAQFRACPRRPFAPDGLGRPPPDGGVGGLPQALGTAPVRTRAGPGGGRGPGGRAGTGPGRIGRVGRRPGKACRGGAPAFPRTRFLRGAGRPFSICAPSSSARKPPLKRRGPPSVSGNDFWTKARNSSWAKFRPSRKRDRTGSA